MTDSEIMAEIEDAALRMQDVVVHTPLVPLHGYRGRRDILLKPETLQPVTNFKIRGVFNAVALLSAEERAKGLSTVSAGNTAQALAWTGRHFGVPARSLMPDTAPQTKIEAVKRYGGEPVLVPTAEVFRFLQEAGWEQEPYAFVHPWTNRDLMIGHGTIGLEILFDLPDVETVYVPVGGGGLMRGVGSALKAADIPVRVVAVEPEGCPALHESLRQGRPATVECRTMCDGVAVPYITDEMFPILREIVDEVVLVAEQDVRATIRRLAFGNRMIVEGSAALPVAAALATPRERRGLSVCIVTGGSIDADRLVQILG
ncbi:MAG: threonine ammonia-lyase [Planctomycetota bacterium]